MSNGYGTIALVLFGMALIIIGLILMAISVNVTSDEGMNITVNESTPEGKSIGLLQNMGFLMGLVLFIMGIGVVIIGFVSEQG